MRYKILLFSLLSISSLSFGQNLDENNIDKIKRNILSYRIFYLSKKTDSEYEFNHDCLLPSLNSNLKIEIERDTIIFPNNKDYHFYRVFNSNYTYSQIDFEEKTTKNNFTCGDIPFSRKFLVAVKDKEILFVSGMFFKDPISSFYKLDKENPTSFIDYLNLKLFNYTVNGIKFKKIKQNRIIFEGFIENKVNTVTIEIDLKNYDNVSIYYNNIKEEILLK